MIGLKGLVILIINYGLTLQFFVDEEEEDGEGEDGRSCFVCLIKYGVLTVSSVTVTEIPDVSPCVGSTNQLDGRCRWK